MDLLLIGLQLAAGLERIFRSLISYKELKVMFEILHPKYAIRMSEDIIPDDMLQRFIDNCGYDPASSKVGCSTVSYRNTGALDLQLHLTKIFKPYGLKLHYVCFFHWPSHIPEKELVHTDWDHYLDGYHLMNIRFNYPIKGKRSIMEWYDIEESSLEKRMVGERQYMEYRVDHLTPTWTMPAEFPCLVNTSIPHAVNMTTAGEDRFVVSATFNHNVTWDDLIQNVQNSTS